MWDHLTPRQLGMGDGNISAIATDGDDVWVGSWTGGLVRYTRSTGRRQVFREGPGLAALAQSARHPPGRRLRLGGNRPGAFGVRSFQQPLAPGAGPRRCGAQPGGGDRRHRRGSVCRHPGAGPVAPRRLPDGVRVGHDLAAGVVHQLPCWWSTETMWIGTIDLGLVSLDLRTGTFRSFDEASRGARSAERHRHRGGG